MKKGIIVTSIVTAMMGLMGCGEPNKAMQGGWESNNQSGIVGGVDIDHTHYLAQYTVALYDTVGGALCSGSIISPTHILTAAHCITGDPKNLLVVFTYDLNDAELFSEAPVGTVAGARLHASWQGAGQSFGLDAGDIAVIKLEEEIPAGFTPVEFLPEDRPLVDGAEVVLAGYGITSAKTRDSGRLRTVTTTVDIAELGDKKTEVLLDQMLGRGACGGDSGGPGFVVEGDGEAVYLWGVTSRGTANCDTKAIYTSAIAFKTWIGLAMEELDHLAEEPLLVAEAQ